ncbi:unnamed protein product [Rhizophagus irregularis]|nr:unnamed protein product [Rhizophagus irregularis]
MRPKIIPGTPLEYKELMEQCWDADATKRPDISALSVKIAEIYSSTNNSFFENSSKGSSNWNNSRVYSFENLPEPRNATKAYHSIQFDFNLQDGLIIAEEKSNKRSYFNDEKDLTVNPNKKVNSNNNEEVQYHEIGYQYMQINYTTSKMDLNYLLN